MMLGGGYVNEHFVKSSLTMSILVLVLLPTMLGIFFPTYDGSMESELNALGEDYYKITGATPTSEEVWGLSGIYTAYGVGPDGNASTAWGSTRDGWVYGSRIVTYSPYQLDDLNGGKESYTVTYDEDKGLYYYTAKGSDLTSVTVHEPGQDETLDPEKGTLYTSVTMDVLQKSNRFFTVGDKTSRENGTFYYEFTGYRYAFQPLRDYKASNDLNVDATTSSLSLIWYKYLNDDGISGQLIISGSDSGIAYITSTQILEAFNQANYSAKFQMVFNGLNMNIYVQINPYALQHYSVEECYEQGYWSVLVTSPSVTDSNGLTMDSFSPDRMWNAVCDLLTFNMDHYGLGGAAGTLASLVFSMGCYTTLIAIGLSVWPVLLLAGLIAAIQALSIL